MPEVAGYKRKRPPTFHHYPVNRAKKLKKAWVEKAKIKTKWRAQKRREGLSHEDESAEPADDDDDDKNAEESGGDGLGAAHSDSESHASQIGGSNSEDDNSGTGSLMQKNESRDKNKTKEESPRKLFQQAYSKSSLHTYKSDPLRRRQNDHINNKQGSSRGGRGQPNMKLRMNAILEKIKRDYT